MKKDKRTKVVVKKKDDELLVIPKGMVESGENRKTLEILIIFFAKKELNLM
jgi:hypothetical protein